MAKIRIDQEALLANSQALENRIRELQELNTRLESLIVRIQSSWEGQASIAYVTKMLAKWIYSGGVEEEWDTYIKELENMKLADWTANMQAAYDRMK